MPTATLRTNDPAGASLRLLTFDAAPRGYDRPGQYVTATLGALPPAFFAIASSPGESLQLLVKEQGDTALAMCACRDGDPIEVSDAMGVGFPLERVDALPLVILVNGSGISAARPVVRAEIARGLPRPIHLLYGVLTPQHRSFLDELGVWEVRGVEVHTVVDASGASGWKGPTGFVQDHAERLGLVRPGVGVVLVGLPVMIEQTKAMYLAAGASPEHLLTNY